MALSVLIWFTASRYPAGIFTLFLYTIQIYRIVSFWYNCVLWTVQRNWQHRVNKTRKEKKQQQHNMCWTSPHKNKHKQRKQDHCNFFLFTIDLSVLIWCTFHATPSVSSHVSLIKFKYIGLFLIKLCVFAEKWFCFCLHEYHIVNVYLRLLNDKKFCCSLIGLSSIFSTLPQSEYNQIAKKIQNFKNFKKNLNLKKF